MTFVGTGSASRARQQADKPPSKTLAGDSPLRRRSYARSIRTTGRMSVAGRVQVVSGESNRAEPLAAVEADLICLAR